MAVILLPGYILVWPLLPVLFWSSPNFLPELSQQGQFTNPETPGYVGFANLPNQVHRKSVKKGFEFTLMVVGEYVVTSRCAKLFFVRPEERQQVCRWVVRDFVHIFESHECRCSAGLSGGVNS